MKFFVIFFAGLFAYYMYSLNEVFIKLYADKAEQLKLPAMLPVDDYDRKVTGFDSVEVLTLIGNKKVRFCYPNKFTQDVDSITSTKTGFVFYSGVDTIFVEYDMKNALYSTKHMGPSLKKY